MFFGFLRYQFYIYFLSAVLPAIFLLGYIDKHDTREKEPASLLWTLVGLGVLSTFVAMVLENLCDSFILPMFDLSNPTTKAILTATSVGIIEEGCKFYFLKKRTWNDVNFNYRYDGVVYAVSVSLGFAAFENLLYVINYGLSVAGPRAFLAVPAHMGFAVFMGAYFGRAKVCYVRQDTFGEKMNLLAGYLVAVALHAFYDATAMIQTAQATAVFVGFVVLMYVVVIHKVKTESAKDRAIY